jgi:hypothetical protein
MNPGASEALTKGDLDLIAGTFRMSVHFQRIRHTRLVCGAGVIGLLRRGRGLDHRVRSTEFCQVTTARRRPSS